MGNARNLAFWVVLFLLVLALFTLFKGDPTSVGGSLDLQRMYALPRHGRT